MTRRTQFNGSAAGRRRVRRADLQSEESSSSEVMHRPTLSLSGSRRSSVERAVNPAGFGNLMAYREQLLRHAGITDASEPVYKQNPKFHKVCNEAGRQIHAVQKVRGRSIPLV